MDFKVYRKTIKKPILWMGTIFLTFLLISMLIIFYAFSFSKHDKVVFAIEMTLNCVLIYLITSIISLNKSSSRVFTDIKIDKDDGKVVSVSFEATKYLHIFIILLCIGSFFIEITSHSKINEISWGEAASNSIGLFIPLFIYNVIFMYLHFSLNKYLLNSSEQIKVSIIERYNEINKIVK